MQRTTAYREKLRKRIVDLRAMGETEATAVSESIENVLQIAIQERLTTKETKDLLRASLENLLIYIKSECSELCGEGSKHEKN